jgi:hypothetical protein
MTIQEQIQDIQLKVKKALLMFDMELVGKSRYRTKIKTIDGIVISFNVIEDDGYFKIINEDDYFPMQLDFTREEERVIFYHLKRLREGRKNETNAYLRKVANELLNSISQ